MLAALLVGDQSQNFLVIIYIEVYDKKKNIYIHIIDFLNIRTDSSHALVRELESIVFLIVTLLKMVKLSPNFINALPQIK